MSSLRALLAALIVVALAFGVVNGLAMGATETSEEIVFATMDMDGCVGCFRGPSEYHLFCSIISDSAISIV
ncbi:hypothetical protein C7T96_01905 [Nitratireductor sp. StC3]|nr:hypothetical protein C7T96_01905 [Nitratireductor sp. StC3]